MKSVSIITPCYNASLFLHDTIRSVLLQTFTDWEWIIADDHSQDSSLKILREQRDERIFVFSTPTHKGAGYARNLCLEKASGRYITFLDADDVWHPLFLETMVGFLQTNQLELAYCSYARCDENLQPKMANFEADAEVTFQNLLKTCRLSLLATMYDSKRVGKEYFPVGTQREDHVMWLNLLKKIPVGKPINKTLAQYRMHEKSVSRKKIKIIKDQYLVYREHLKFSISQSLYFTFNWAFNGFLKYSRIFN